MIKVILIIGIALLIAYKIYDWHRRKYVEDNSKRYNELIDIVKRLKIEERAYKEHFKGSYAFDTKQKYDNENNRNSVFQEYLLENKESFKNVLKSIHYNKKLEAILQKVYRELESLPEIDKFKNMEKDMMRKAVNNTSFQDGFGLHFKTSYTSPKGQNHYEDNKDISKHELYEILKNLKEEKDERTEYEIFRDAERAKMTAGLRYDILKRDKFTCKYCGASSTVHGVTLHVDHIKPVANGGRTEKNNLQTLCRDCNLGKGTKD